MDTYRSATLAPIMKDTICDIAYMAGELMVDNIAAGFNVEEKSSFKDLVTDVDKEVEAFIRAELASAFPDKGFIGEEDGIGAERDSADGCFVVDPLDGTANMAAGFAASSISIGYVENAHSTCGVVYNPFTQEMFHAEKGKGAFISTLAGTPVAAMAQARSNESKGTFGFLGRSLLTYPISVSDKPFENNLTMVGTSPYDQDELSKDIRFAYHVALNTMDVRRFGSAALDICFVAAGRAGAYFEMQLKPWDYAGASIILEEAGGVMETAEGGYPSFIRASNILACNSRETESKVREILADIREK